MKFYSIINANTFVLTQSFCPEPRQRNVVLRQIVYCAMCEALDSTVATCVHMNNKIVISVGILSFNVAVNGLTWTVSSTDWNSGILNYLFSGFWFMLTVYSINLLVVMYYRMWCMCVCGVCACL